MKRRFVVLGAIGVLATVVAIRFPRPEQDAVDSRAPDEEFEPSRGQVEVTRTELIEIDTSRNPPTETRSAVDSLQSVDSEPDWPWLLENRCGRKSALPSDQQHWFERYVRLGRGRARLRASPTAAHAVDVLALAIETHLDVRGRFATTREDALASGPGVMLRSGARFYPIRSGEFALLDELHALWRQDPKQVVSSTIQRQVEADVESALSEARPRFPQTLLHKGT